MSYPSDPPAFPPYPYGLFVCDASLFPTAVGVNPAETIQALSTRNAAHIIESREALIR